MTKEYEFAYNGWCGVTISAESRDTRHESIGSIRCIVVEKIIKDEPIKGTFCMFDFDITKVKLPFDIEMAAAYHDDDGTKISYSKIFKINLIKKITTNIEDEVYFEAEKYIPCKPVTILKENINGRREK